MLNRFAQHAIACVLCELLCLELFNVFFQHENRFRYKFFDIVQFSRTCAPQPQRLTTWLFYHRSDFLSSIFSEAFRFYWTCGSFFNVSILVLSLCFCRFQKSFFPAAPWRSSIIPHPQPSVNTFLHLFWDFSIFLEFVSFPRPGVSFLSHKQHKAPRENAGLWNTNDHSSPRPDSARYRVVSSVYSKLAPTGRP